MIFTRDFVTRENYWQIASLVTQKSLFTVTHALFFISCLDDKNVSKLSPVRNTHNWPHWGRRRVACGRSPCPLHTGIWYHWIQRHGTANWRWEDGRFSNSSNNHKLTHWGQDQTGTMLQTISNIFSWMKMLEFRLKFHWSLFSRVQLTIFQHWFR